MYEGLVASRQLLIDWLQSLPTTTGIPPSPPTGGDRSHC
jgi:phospholipase/carboxylesterase